MADVVIFEVVHVGIVQDEQVAIGEADDDGQRVWFGRFVHGDARKQVAAKLDGRRPVHRPGLHAGQFERQLPHHVEIGARLCRSSSQHRLDGSTVYSGPMRALLTVAAACTLAAGLHAADRIPAAGGDIEITPILHASVQIEHAGTVIQVDPWSAGDLAHAKAADLILVTDDPIHHLDPKAIAQLRKPGAPVVMPAIGKAKIPDGIVLANGETTEAAGVRVEAVAAYDIKPGAPEHPKGKSNGYVLTVGGRRLYISGVTECVAEVKALAHIDVAFMPMNIPPDRMSPSETAACTKAINPQIVYVYHYDQDLASRAANPNAAARGLPGGITVDESLRLFREAMKGSPTELRLARWY
jgi:L-ascorbate metabolism protein UlaG (beta-lactamase superfamily)